MSETVELQERETGWCDQIITFKVSEGSGMLSRNTLTIEYEGIADAEIVAALVRVIDRAGNQAECEEVDDE